MDFSDFPKDYGLLIGSFASGIIVNFMLSGQVMKARKQMDVNYPHLYAPHGHKHEKEFNSVQRGHQNFIESYAIVQFAALYNGIFFPRTASALNFTWAIGRYLYGTGYASGGPKGRTFGAVLSHIGDLPLFLMSFYTSYMIFSQGK
eukprot:m.332681 g.332681  ORF g.332681 m.332681 type:complete len:146 (+) comp16988_c0_seq1:60-497(+)